MRLIGIKLISGDSSVIKNLDAKWYPFCNVPTLAREPESKTLKYSVGNDFYLLKDFNNLNISISCIVGKNGSGKSTLLDIIYRTINNFSWHIKQLNETIPCDLIYAYGFHSRLYFEINNLIGYIEIDATDIYGNGSKDCICWEIGTPPIFLNRNEFPLTELSHFFYTIVTNYSIYAFNPDDYKYEKEYKEESYYINGIFNKNDSYITPIVMIPYRNDQGIIHTENERKLAIQRIVALSVFLAKEYKDSLIDGEKIHAISYKFNDNYITEKKDNKHKDLIENIKSVWENYYSKTLENIKEENVKEACLFYLSRKTFKLIDWYGLRNENNILSARQKRNQIKEFSFDDIETILKDESFITLKIRQTDYFIRNPFSDLLKGNLIINKDARFQFPQKRIKKVTVDDYFFRFPPPFYDYDLLFKKNSKNKKGYSLSKMSSGEKQILFNISYILYHLKNLDTKDSIMSQTNMNTTPPYKNALLIFDEAEIYLHPEFQRRYIFLLLSAINKCHFEKVRNFHIIFATHSPYLLSDVLHENILLLENKENNNQNFSCNQSFCANLYDLLNNQFFIDAPIGEFANQKILEISDLLSKEKVSNLQMIKIKEFEAQLGDEYTRQIIEYLIERNKLLGRKNV